MRRSFIAVAALLVGCGPSGEPAAIPEGCVPPAAWPPLPSSEEMRAQPPFRHLFADGSMTVIDTTTPIDASVVVPQYAYFVNATLGTCRPVIVVLATPVNFGYYALDRSSSGGARRSMFHLLGTRPPAPTTRTTP